MDLELLARNAARELNAHADAVADTQRQLRFLDVDVPLRALPEPPPTGRRRLVVVAATAAAAVAVVVAGMVARDHRPTRAPADSVPGSVVVPAPTTVAPAPTATLAPSPTTSQPVESSLPTTVPAAIATSIATPDEPVLLDETSVDGISFGTDMSVVMPAIEATLGAGLVEQVGVGFTLDGCSRAATARWDGAGLMLGFADAIADTAQPGGGCDNRMALVAWSLYQPQDVKVNAAAVRVRGVGLGATVGEVRAAMPEVRDVMFTPASDAGYELRLGELPNEIRMITDWEWVATLQSALNARGASLAVDGQPGPRTVAAFQQVSASMPGSTTREVLDSLAVTLPDAANVTAFLAGAWSPDDGCGQAQYRILEGPYC